MQAVVASAAAAAAALTYMLASLEERPEAGAMKSLSLTEEPADSGSPPPSGPSARGCREPPDSPVGVSRAASPVLAYRSSIWVVVLLRA